MCVKALFVDATPTAKASTMLQNANAVQATMAIPMIYIMDVIQNQRLAHLIKIVLMLNIAMKTHVDASTLIFILCFEIDHFITLLILQPSV